jgi:hypothetical protein
MHVADLRIFIVTSLTRIFAEIPVDADGTTDEQTQQ